MYERSPGGAALRPHRLPLRRARLGAVAAATLVVLSVLSMWSAPADAGNSDHGQPTVQINPGGGQDSQGADGLRIVLNSDGVVSAANFEGQDQIFYRGQPQYCCAAVAPSLNIGGTLYGEAGPAAGATSWTSLQLVGVTGAARTQGETDTGSGTARYRYTATHNGRDYVVDRLVSYTYPNNYFSDSYEITIPAGNTDAVKFYLGGDTAPGGSDTGNGIMLTSPVRSIYSVNPNTNIQVGLTEAAGSAPFDGATANGFSLPYGAVAAGGDIGFAVDPNNHDAGLMMQWTLGSTPGTYARALRASAGPQGTTLSATLRDEEVDPGDEVILDLEAVNTSASNNTDIDFRFQLPSGLVIGAGATANSCNGTFTATAGASLIELQDGTVASATNCVVSVPVVGASAGSYQLTSSSVVQIGGLFNGVGTSTLVLTTPGQCPTDHGWNVVVDQTSRLYRAVLGRSADASGLAYWTRLRLNGLTARGLADLLLASDERQLATGTLTDTQFVEELYQDVLGRGSDSVGLAYWVGQLGAGLHRANLVLFFSDSAEHVASTSTRTAMSDNQSMTCRLYETLFERSPDDSGFAYWTGLLDAGVSPRQLVAAMLATPEGMAVTDLSDSAYIAHLYQSALNRAGDSGGLAYWESLLAGNGRAAVALWLANVYEG